MGINIIRFWGHLTESESQRLVTFKTLIFANLDNYPIDISDYIDDLSCLRFLRARKFDVAKAIEMFGKHIKWRHDYKMDQIFQFRFTEIEEFRKFYPKGYHNTDLVVIIKIREGQYILKEWGF